MFSYLRTRKRLERSDVEVFIVPERHRKAGACWGGPKLQKLARAKCPVPSSNRDRASSQHPKRTEPEDKRA